MRCERVGWVNTHTHTHTCWCYQLSSFIRQVGTSRSGYLGNTKQTDKKHNINIHLETYRHIITVNMIIDFFCKQFAWAVPIYTSVDLWTKDQASRPAVGCSRLQGQSRKRLCPSPTKLSTDHDSGRSETGAWWGPVHTGAWIAEFPNWKSEKWKS